jgi:hypothetical protein
VPAQTSKTPGDGSGTLSYTLASDSFDVESVYVSVDATTATGPVTAELTVRDQSGVVIARKKQAATIPAGQAGSATWALRLDDEGAESAYTTIQEEGVSLPKEKILDFVGAGVTAADDPVNARTTVTIPGGGGGGGGGLPWAIATEAGYGNTDWYFGRSPDPLSYTFFNATPSAPYRAARRYRVDPEPPGLGGHLAGDDLGSSSARPERCRRDPLPAIQSLAHAARGLEPRRADPVD